MRCYSVRLLLVSMLATHHTDFESFTNALGALPNQPPVPMECEPSPSPIDVDAKAIVQQVVNVLLKHSSSPAVHLERDPEFGSNAQRAEVHDRASRRTPSVARGKSKM